MLATSFASVPHKALSGMSQSGFLRRYLGRPYILVNTWIWNNLVASFTSSPLVRAYGDHLHHLILLRPREQVTGTFFFRNRPELDLMVRLLAQKQHSDAVNLTVLGCSKGAEVYSISYAIRTARPDLNVNLRALDISEDVLHFAQAGVYSIKAHNGEAAPSGEGGDVHANTMKDQSSSVFERMSSAEMDALFDREGEEVHIKPRFRDGIAWNVGDANDLGLIGAIGLQDIVVANRFLCHMPPDEAEKCLSTLSKLVKPGGYLFVSGVDLDVRTKVATKLGWRPVTEMIREVHEGDPSLRGDWPFKYWGLEPLDEGRSDWQLRYASVFQTS